MALCVSDTWWWEVSCLFVICLTEGLVHPHAELFQNTHYFSRPLHFGIPHQVQDVFSSRQQLLFLVVKDSSRFFHEKS